MSDVAAEVEVVGERAPPDRRDLDIEPSDVDLADVFERHASATVLRLGADGDYATVSLRGASPRHVGMWLDGIPLNPDGAAAVDLSEWPASWIETIQLTPGPPPVALASAPIGGAVTMTSRWDVPGLRWDVGSFGRMGLAVAHHGVAALVQHTDGDFPLLDDAGTPSAGLDDAILRRANNDRTAGQLLAGHGVGPVRTLGHLAWTDEGVPGAQGAGTPGVRLRTRRALAGLRWTASPNTGATASAVLREEQLDDPLGSLDGAPSATSARSAHAGLATDHRHIVGPWRVEGAVNANLATLAVDGDVPASALRGVGSAAVDAGWDGGHASLVGGVQATGGSDGAPVGAAVPRLRATFRTRTTAVGAWFAGGHRLPDLDERHAVRGSFQGNPDLRPERSLGGGVDAIATVGPLQVAGGSYVRVVRDAIAWSQNAQRVFVPLNLGRVVMAGVDGGASGSWGRFSPRLAGTVASAVVHDGAPDTVGQRVPGLPPWRLTGGLDVGLPAATSAGVEAAADGGVALDSIGLRSTPPRADIGLVASWKPAPAWHLSGAVRHPFRDVAVAVVPVDPLDAAAGQRVAAVVDHAGWPLPGRRFGATVTWSPP